jgi:hypothetical protein
MLGRATNRPAPTTEGRERREKLRPYYLNHSSTSFLLKLGKLAGLLGLPIIILLTTPLAGGADISGGQRVSIRYRVVKVDTSATENKIYPVMSDFVNTQMRKNAYFGTCMFTSSVLLSTCSTKSSFEIQNFGSKRAARAVRGFLTTQSPTLPVPDTLY